MPMLTSHVDCPTPSIRRSGSFTTIEWESGLAIQLDANEWAALLDAISEVSATQSNHGLQHRALHRDESTVRTDAEIREALQ